jgi:hypothetical protein
MRRMGFFLRSDAELTRGFRLHSRKDAATFRLKAEASSGSDPADGRRAGPSSGATNMKL